MHVNAGYKSHDLLQQPGSNTRPRECLHAYGIYASTSIPSLAWVYQEHIYIYVYIYIYISVHCTCTIPWLCLSVTDCSGTANPVHCTCIVPWLCLSVTDCTGTVRPVHCTCIVPSLCMSVTDCKETVRKLLEHACLAAQVWKRTIELECQVIQSDYL